MSECNMDLMCAAKPTPRTCEVCGLGPCRVYPSTPAPPKKSDTLAMDPISYREGAKAMQRYAKEAALSLQQMCERNADAALSSGHDELAEKFRAGAIVAEQVASTIGIMPTHYSGRPSGEKSL
jgi:hypothetical protein